MKATIVTRYKRFAVVVLTRAPRRLWLPGGGAALRHRLAPLRARCSPGPYYEYCALRPPTRSGARGTCGHMFLRPARSSLVGPLLEHLEHAVGDDEPADDVGGGEHHGDEREHAHEEARVWRAHDDDRADDDDPVDRVRPGHERRVQERRHLRDHLEPDEGREHEDCQLRDELVAHARPSPAS